MEMRNQLYILLITLFVVNIHLYGQNVLLKSKKEGTMVVRNNKYIKYDDIQIYIFTSTAIPDSLEVCGGEWLVEGEASELSELDEAEVRRIKGKVSPYGCKVVFVDLKKLFSETKGFLYILGLKTKSSIE